MDVILSLTRFVSTHFEKITHFEKKNSKCIYNRNAFWKKKIQAALNLGLTWRTLKNNIFFPKKDLFQSTLKKKKKNQKEYYATASMNFLIFKSIVCDRDSLNLYKVTNPDMIDADCIALLYCKN
jgi:hypothetical protein